MNQSEAIAQIEEGCRTISLAMMKVTPAIRFLNDEETQSDVLKASHQLTFELEVIKKQLVGFLPQLEHAA